MVLIAGKGHEDYQEIAGVKRPFSDVDEARARAGAPRRRRAVAMTDAGRRPHALLPGAALVGDGARRASRACTATRARLQPGDLFVALRGERFDGHDFLPQARAAGAVAALAERGLAAAGLPGLQVADTLRGAAAAGRAPGARASTLPLIAVTGSNGKTTVTQMIAVDPARLAAATRRWPPRATSTTTSACR
ncbi:MAG: Mur ligase domain-containing protein [Comamonadaceae bacterium]|nr:Mur ligase domain-containing protein [Comamonadaceae bacterium]